MTRAQVNEMCWVVRHHIPKMPVSSKYFNPMKREINHSFWLKYAKSMRVVDKGSNVTQLNSLSPGALQQMWEKIVAPNVVKLSKEVFILDREKKKLDTRRANQEKFKIC